ncbi:MAG: hypothetical protein K8E24_005370 [Methanobacterium paludis]|nr:hypothetical protein [Methanobacterium paludis]
MNNVYIKELTKNQINPYLYDKTSEIYNVDKESANKFLTILGLCPCQYEPLTINEFLNHEKDYFIKQGLSSNLVDKYVSLNTLIDNIKQYNDYVKVIKVTLNDNIIKYIVAVKKPVNTYGSLVRTIESKAIELAEM